MRLALRQRLPRNAGNALSVADFPAAGQFEIAGTHRRRNAYPAGGGARSVVGRQSARDRQWIERGGMSLGRREFLIGSAGAAVFGARAVRAASEDPGLQVPNRRAAYEPWRSWRADGIQSPLTVVHAAVLAANAHDTQPWRFQGSSDRVVRVAAAAGTLGPRGPLRPPVA